MRIRAQFGVQLFGGVANVLILVALTPLLIKSLGLERYGLLLLILSFVVYVGLADLGLGPATTQRIAATHDSKERARIIGAAVLMSVILGAAAGLIFALLSLSAVGALIGLTPDVAHELSSAAGGLFFLGLTTIISGVPQGALLGMSRFTAYNVNSLLVTAASILSPATYAVCFGNDIAGLIFAVAIGRLITACIGFLSCLQAGLVPSFWPVNWNTARHLLGYGGWSTAMALMHRATNSIDRPFIGAIAGAGLIPYFAIPQGVLSRTNFVSAALMSAVFPRLAQTKTSDHSRILDNCYRSILMLTPCYVAAILLTPTLITVWLGAAFAAKASACAVLLALSAWIDAVSFVPYTYLQAAATPRREAVIGAALLLPNMFFLTVAITLGGIEGAAIVSVVRSIAYFVGRGRATGGMGIPLMDLVISALAVSLSVGMVLWMDGGAFWVAAAILVGASTCFVCLRLPPFALELIREAKIYLARRRPSYER
jgi:O-antigen/teichoic acid export membrane protein